MRNPWSWDERAVTGEKPYRVDHNTQIGLSIPVDDGNFDQSKFTVQLDPMIKNDVVDRKVNAES